MGSGYRGALTFESGCGVITSTRFSALYRGAACQTFRESGSGPPEGINGKGAQAVSEGKGLLAGVEHISGDEPLA